MPDHLVITLAHCEDHIDDSPEDKDDKEARCVSESGEAPGPASIASGDDPDSVAVVEYRSRVCWDSASRTWTSVPTGLQRLCRHRTLGPDVSHVGGVGVDIETNIEEW